MVQIQCTGSVSCFCLYYIVLQGTRIINTVLLPLASYAYKPTFYHQTCMLKRLFYEHLCSDVFAFSRPNILRLIFFFHSSDVDCMIAPCTSYRLSVTRHFLVWFCFGDFCLLITVELKDKTIRLMTKRFCSLYVD